MNGDWRLTRLGDVLQNVSRPMRLNPENTYRLVGAHWYAKGLYVKEQKNGSEIQAKTLFEVKEGDFVYNRLFAWKGSFAVASKEVDGCFVSNEFPCFAPLDSVDPKFLWFYFSRPGAWSEALGLSSGSTPTSRNRLKEEQFLNMEVLLPPIDEQRRIVSRIEGFSDKVREIRRLRAETRAEQSRMLLAAYREVIEGAKSMLMDDVAPLVRRPVQVEPLGEYYELGIRSFGKGTFHKPPVTGAMLGSKRIFRIEPGDLLFNIVFAWEGAVAVAQPQDRGRVGSHRFLTCVPGGGHVLTSFLAFHFLTDRGREDLGIASPGGAGRNRTLGIEALARIKVPVPAAEKQRWFASLLEKAETVNCLQAEVTTELDALMPSILSKAFRGEL